MNLFRQIRNAVSAIMAVVLSLMTFGCDRDTASSTAVNSHSNDFTKFGSTFVDGRIERTIQFTDGRIDLYHPIENREAPELLVPFVSKRQAAPSGEFILRLMNQPSDSSRIVGAELYSNSGSILFGVMIEIDSVNLEWARISEYTAEDRLSMLRIVAGDSVVEWYTENSTSFSVRYSRELFESLVGHDQGFGGDSLESEYMAVSEYFDSQYSGENSLTANSYGNLLISLAFNRELYSWLELHHAELNMPGLHKDVSLDDVCFVAEICAMIKCSPFGGSLLNPLCVPCTGVGAACLIADAVAFISKWFD